MMIQISTHSDKIWDICKIFKPYIQYQILNKVHKPNYNKINLKAMTI